jgi:hypothetical protein
MNKRMLSIALTLALALGSIFFYRNSLLVQSQTLTNNYRMLVEESPSAEAKAITLYEAWDAAQTYAQAWSEDTVLISLESSDIDDLDAEQAGQDGRRRTWHGAFTSPKLNKQLFLQITDGVIVKAIEDGIHDPAIPVVTEKPAIDSPEALKRAKEAKPDLDFGFIEGKGYHFILQIGKNDKPTLSVRGSYRIEGDKKSPAIVILDPETGQIEAQYYTVAPLGGILYSADAGKSWHASSLTGQMINAIAKDLSKQDVAYAITTQVGGLYLYQSEDGGQKWTAKGKLPAEAGEWAYSLTVVSNLNGITYLLVGTTSGLWSSTGGNDWNLISGLPAGPTQWLAVLQDGETVKVFITLVTGPNAGSLYSSTDLASWTKEVGGVFRLSQSFDYKAVAATNEEQDQALLFTVKERSTLKVPLLTLRLAGDFIGTGPTVLDGGENGKTLRGDKKADNPNWENTLSAGLASLAASPDLPNNPVLLAGGFRTGIYRSSDGGNVWENVLPNPSLIVPGNDDIYSILFLSNERVIAINGGEFAWTGF